MTKPALQEVPETEVPLEGFLKASEEETIGLSTGAKVRIKRPKISDPLVQVAGKLISEARNLAVANMEKGINVAFDSDAVLETRIHIACIRACAVVDENQREFTEDEWIQIITACEEPLNKNPLILRTSDLISEVVNMMRRIKVDPT